MRRRLEFLAVKSIEIAVRPFPLRIVRRWGETLGWMFYAADRVIGASPWQTSRRRFRDVQSESGGPLRDRCSSTLAGCCSSC